MRAAIAFAYILDGVFYHWPYDDSINQQIQGPGLTPTALRLCGRIYPA